MLDDSHRTTTNGKRKKVPLDGGRVHLEFKGSININALGTTMVILGSFALLVLIVSGVFFRG
jgi:hypothetical protein